MRILPNKPGYRDLPTLDHQMHCVVFVLAADTVSFMAKGIQNKFIQIRDLANKRSNLVTTLLDFISSQKSTLLY